jgi:hypothetical protein
MKNFQITWHDLSEDAQKDFLDFCEVEESDINMDIPLCSFSLKLDKEWVLVNAEEKEVLNNAILKCFKGKEYKLISSSPPHKPSSSGKVFVHSIDDVRDTWTYYPSVFKLKWVKR